MYLKKLSPGFVLVLLLVIPVFGEIIVNSQNPGLDKHSFVVRRLETTPATGYILSSINIEQIVFEANIGQCKEANLSFMLTNPDINEHVYTFGVEKFIGEVYITPNLVLGSKKAAIVDYVLVPNCSVIGDINPKITVETETEIAKVPAIIHINKTLLDDNECLAHFDQSICDSAYYVRFKEDTKYEIDLSGWFKDPDNDVLEYGYENGINIDVKIRGNTAILRPKKDWHGTEEIIFTAKDNKGGFAESKTFYVQILDSEEVSFWDWLNNLFS